MYTPDLLTMTDGTPVTSSAQWEARRGELLNILAREQYGTFLPPSTASARVMAPPMPACAGHAMQETLEVRFDTPAGEFAFPLRFLYPADGQVHPLFLLLNFRPLIPDIYCPAEEILDNGFALAVVCYTDITADDSDWGSIVSDFTRRVGLGHTAEGFIACIEASAQLLAQHIPKTQPRNQLPNRLVML